MYAQPLITGFRVFEGISLLDLKKNLKTLQRPLRYSLSPQKSQTDMAQNGASFILPSKG